MTLAVMLFGRTLSQGSVWASPASTQGHMAAAQPAFPLISCSPFGFSPATNFTVGTSLDSVAVRDFNRDGNLDMATANALSANV